MDSLNRATFLDGLRVHPEPFEYVDERSVHDALAARPLEYLDYLDRCLTRIAAGEIACSCRRSSSRRASCHRRGLARAPRSR